MCRRKEMQCLKGTIYPMVVIIPPALFDKIAMLKESFLLKNHVCYGRDWHDYRDVSYSRDAILITHQLR